MLTFHEYSRLGPEATKKQDKEEITRQKNHLMNKSSESNHHADTEVMNGENGGASRAKAVAYATTAKNIKEDAVTVAAPTNTVASVAGSGDTRLPASQREPGVSKKHTPTLLKMARRKLPRM